MDRDLRTGPVVSADGSVNAERSDNQGAAVTTEAHGRYHEAVVRDNVFFAGSQAADTWAVALDTTHLGLCISNPAGSSKNLSILQAGFALSVAPVAEASIHLAGGYAAAGVTVHTNALTVYNAKIGSAETGVGLADDAATLVGTPIYLQPLIGAFTAAALPAGPAGLTDIGGAIMVPPGGYVCIVALTAVVGFGTIVWEEIAA